MWAKLIEFVAKNSDKIVAYTTIAYGKIKEYYSNKKEAELQKTLAYEIEKEKISDAEQKQKLRDIQNYQNNNAVE